MPPRGVLNRVHRNPSRVLHCGLDPTLPFAFFGQSVVEPGVFAFAAWVVVQPLCTRPHLSQAEHSGHWVPSQRGLSHAFRKCDMGSSMPTEGAEAPSMDRCVVSVGSVSLDEFPVNLVVAEFFNVHHQLELVVPLSILNIG